MWPKEIKLIYKPSLNLYVVIGLFIAALFSPLAADDVQQSPLAAKAQAIVEAAHAFVQHQSHDMAAVQKAFETDTRFRDDQNQLYIFMHAYNARKKEAICIAQGIRPELIGKNMWNLRTPNGRLLFQEEVQLIETRKQFWLEYDWLNPYTKTIETKRSFFKKIVLPDGRNAWIGCGFWEK